MSEVALPGNETREHFLLKQIALIWLKERGSQYVATEVDGMFGGTDADYATTYQKRYNWAQDEYLPARVKRSRSIADVVGVQKSWPWKPGGHVTAYTVRSVEVKASRADFLTGYCTGGHLAYVLTPRGLVAPDELQPGIGLMEADVDKLEGLQRLDRIARLVKVVHRPRRQKDWSRDPMQIVETIAARYTNDAVYKNPWLGGYRRE